MSFNVLLGTVYARWAPRSASSPFLTDVIAFFMFSEAHLLHCLPFDWHLIES